MENQIYNILNDMAEFLNVMQMKKLQKVLIYHLNEAKQVQEEISNEKYLEMFLTAKQIEGCSDRTIQYYRVTIEHAYAEKNHDTTASDCDGGYSAVFD